MLIFKSAHDGSSQNQNFYSAIDKSGGNPTNYQSSRSFATAENGIEFKTVVHDSTSEYIPDTNIGSSFINYLKTLVP